jgi:SAM-dependent methyltransferase
VNWSLLLPFAVIVGLALNGHRLRSRLRSLQVMSDRGGDAAAVTFVTAAGGEAPAAARAAAAGHADRFGLMVLDLVPADTHVVAALDLVSCVDPATYRGDRLAPGRGAGCAALVDHAVGDRVGRPAGPLDPGEYARFMADVKPFACTATSLAVAPGVRAPRYDLGKRRSVLATLGISPPFALTLPVLGHLALVASLLLAPSGGLVALVVYGAQRYYIFGGGPLRPRGLHLAALARPLYDPYVWLRTLTGRWQSAAELADECAVEAARPGYLNASHDTFFEPRAKDCPWCGALRPRQCLLAGDLVQRKPGVFRLDRCERCGHVFQNPRLSPAGLEYYHRDLRDGLGLRRTDSVMRGLPEAFEGRATIVAPFATPKSWLDVGAGHGHFCNYAREIWPDTTFDGLDTGAAIEVAERRGWVARAHQGALRDLASELTGRYDVVSMHNYLARTPDPLAELDAAARVLPPGGHLLVEAPDPQWPLRRLLGRFWMAWLPPRHLHLMPLRNLREALVERGFTVLATERGGAHSATDLTLAAYLRIATLGPKPVAPWTPPRTAGWHRLAAVARGAVWSAGVPLLIAAAGMDALIRLVACRVDRGNAYRLLARKDDDRG